MYSFCRSQRMSSESAKKRGGSIEQADKFLSFICPLDHKASTERTGSLAPKGCRNSLPMTVTECAPNIVKRRGEAN